MGGAMLRFARLLDSAPWVKPYWDMARRECDLDALRGAMAGWSHGERIMAQFAVAVWRGENELRFDLVEAASVLDDENRRVIAAWLARPFWP